jgi:nucleotide-binding universal stress UspA family protein
MIKINVAQAGFCHHPRNRRDAMYAHILLPLAYEAGQTPEAEIAVARHLLSEGGKLTLLHVMDKLPLFAIDYMPAGYREELIAAIKADLAQHAAGFAHAEVRVVEGDAGPEILECAAEGAECIVMAAHRSDRRLFGSTAARVARHAPCAVHLLR